MKVQQFTVGTMGVCCYLVSCEASKKAVVIDAGGDSDKILAELRSADLQLEAIVSTHCHPDHVCGNREIQEATGAPIIMHRADVEFSARPEVQEYFSHLGLEASPPVNRSVEDGEEIVFGDEVLTVIHTPGHTPGGMCLHGDGNLFSGDTLFVTAVGRSDFIGGDHAQLINSIKTRLLVLDDDTIVWPGHGYGGDRSHIAFERRANPFLK